MKKYAGIFLGTLVFLTLLTLFFFRPILLVKVGDVFFDKGRIDKAVVSYFAATQVSEDAVEGYLGLARIFEMQNHTDAAVKALKMGAEQSNKIPDDKRTEELQGIIIEIRDLLIEKLISLGDAAYKNENYQEAIEYYKELVKYDGDTPRSYLKMAEVYQSLGDTEEAVAILKMAPVMNDEIQDQIGQLIVEQEVRKEYEELLDMLGNLLR